MNSDFEKFNMYLKSINKQFKGKRPLYVIAFYDMYDFKYITGDISENIEELKTIYDEKYQDTILSHAVTPFGVDSVRGEHRGWRVRQLAGAQHAVH